MAYKNDNKDNSGFLYNGQRKRSLPKIHQNKNKPVRKYYKISGNTATNFFVRDPKFKSIHSLLIVNSHITDAVTVTLYEQKDNIKIGETDVADISAGSLRSPQTNIDEDSEANQNWSNPLDERNTIGSEKGYILQKVVIPNGASLLLDSEDLIYTDATQTGGLYIQLGASDSEVSLRVIENFK